MNRRLLFVALTAGFALAAAGAVAAQSTSDSANAAVQRAIACPSASTSPPPGIVRNGASGSNGMPTAQPHLVNPTVPTPTPKPASTCTPAPTPPPHRFN